jgi:hypothetical protein
MADTEQRIDLSQAIEVSGELLPQANAVQLSVVRRGGERTTLTIPAADLQRLVPLLLLLGRALPQVEPDLGAKLSLVPTDSLSVGELPGGETLLAVAVGPATVGFSMPAAAAEKLGRSLLLAGSEATGPTSVQ